MLSQILHAARLAAVGIGLVACQAVPEQGSAPVETSARIVLSGAPSVPGVDAPELARLGQYAVGTTLETLALPARAALTTDSGAKARLETVSRKLTARIWYPAQAPPGTEPVRYAHALVSPGSAGRELLTQGIAFADAKPVESARFPLVVVSHGYGGWSESMSYLTENLASKGYVVAAIDHLDMRMGSSTNGQIDFGNVLMDRARDQREVIAALVKSAATARTGFAGLIDAERIGLIGYSMGGYGALATAGADYDPASPTLKLIPAGGGAVLLQDSGPDVSADIKALVTIAPWGGQPPLRMWTAPALKKVRAPVLIIDGDQDDIVDFAKGVRWLFDELSSDRHLLVFQGARHNVGNIPAAPNFAGPFSAFESFAEPIWRTDRINAINQHFVTAFLDLNLKGYTSKAAFFDVPTQQSGEGVWKGPSANGATAGDAQPGYWRGFQPRWALGLELHHRDAE